MDPSKTSKPKHARNYIPHNRKWVTIKRHSPVVTKSIYAGIISALVWGMTIYHFDWSFPKEDENAILFISLMFSAFTYVIFAGYAVNKVLDEYKIVSKAVVKNDLETFLLYRDEQLPILIHLPVAGITFVFVFFVMFFPFSSAWIGGISVFSVVFMVTLIYKVVMELDNYENSIWFKEKIPPEWYKINIERYFKEKGQ
ncbi:MAG: hypothetical protein WC603_02855 [Candidatus Paceibacterota bacterium]|jgi:hypothetical protein